MTSEREEDFAWEEQGVWLEMLAVLSLEEQGVWLEVLAVLSWEEQEVWLEVLAVLSWEEQGAVEAGQVCYPHHS